MPDDARVVYLVSDMAQRWPKAILFDFDGVLVNSEPLHFLAFHDVLKQEQIELTEREYYDNLIGFDDRGAFRQIFAQHNKPLDSKTLLRVMTHKGEAMKELIRQRRFSALPGAEEFVRALWRSYPLAICSGALRDEIEVMLEGISLRDCFRTIIAAEDVTVGKPDPQGYLLAMRQVGVRTKHPLDPGDCLVIEDAPRVIQSVKEVGFPVLGVANTHSIESLKDANWQVSSLKPEVVAKQIPQLKMLVS